MCHRYSIGFGSSDALLPTFDATMPTILQAVRNQLAQMEAEGKLLLAPKTRPVVQLPVTVESQVSAAPRQTCSPPPQPPLCHPFSERTV